MKRAIISGVPLVQGWDGWLLMALPTLGAKRLQYVLPFEGYNIYQDCYCIPVGAPSPYAAHLLMNFLMDPKVAAETINYTWYHTPIPQAKAWVDKIVLSFGTQRGGAEAGPAGDRPRCLHGEVGRGLAEDQERVKWCPEAPCRHVMQGSKESTQSVCVPRQGQGATHWGCYGMSPRARTV